MAPKTARKSRTNDNRQPRTYPERVLRDEEGREVHVDVRREEAAAVREQREGLRHAAVRRDDVATHAVLHRPVQTLQIATFGYAALRNVTSAQASCDFLFRKNKNTAFRK